MQSMQLQKCTHGESGSEFSHVFSYDVRMQCIFASWFVFWFTGSATEHAEHCEQQTEDKKNLAPGL